MRLQWSREDDIRFDYYHTSTAVQVEAGLDAKGKPEAWIQRTAFPPIGTSFNTKADQGSAGELGLGFTGLPWDVPNLRCEVGKAKAPTRIGWLRSVNCIPHAFAEGSFADELAAKAGKDPLKYLHELLGSRKVLKLKDEGTKRFPLRDSGQYPYDLTRFKAVLDLVAKESGWGKKLPKGQGMGICVHRSFLSYAACAVEVEVTKAGKLTLKRVHIGIDCGLAINPDRVRAQLEGSVIFGATLALFGQISFDKGRVLESNFDRYQMLRMHEAPKVIKTHIIESDAPPAGVGEPGTPPVAPAICNAIFAATGKRIRALPIMNHDLSWK